MEIVKEVYEKAWRSIIAPPKYQYTISSMCPKEQTINNRIIERIDFTVKNDQGKTISAMILKDKNIINTDAILYFHGNGGTKTEILGCISTLSKQKITIISFDFIGCGNSDDGYLTYGMKESFDAEVVLRQAYKYINIEKLTVWGRSMGALTAIMFAQKNHKLVDKLVLDGPFKSLQKVIKRVIKNESNLPEPFIAIVFHFLKKQVEQKLKFPLFSQDYLQRFKKIPKNIPVLVICSQNDAVVSKQQVYEFFKACKADKQVIKIAEGHDDDRSIEVYTQVLKWIRRERSKKNMKLKLFRPQDEFDCSQNEQICSVCC